MNLLKYLDEMLGFKDKRMDKLEKELISSLTKVLNSTFSDIASSYLIFGELEAENTISEMKNIIKKYVRDNAINILIYSSGGGIIDAERLTYFFLNLRKKGYFVRMIGYKDISSAAIPVFFSGTEKILLGDVNMLFHRVRFEVNGTSDKHINIDTLKECVLSRCNDNDNVLKVRRGLNLILKEMKKVENLYISLIRKTTNGSIPRKEIKKFMQDETILNQDNLLDLNLIDDYIPLPE